MGLYEYTAYTKHIMLWQWISFFFLNCKHVFGYVLDSTNSLNAKEMSVGMFCPSLSWGSL